MTKIGLSFSALGLVPAVFAHDLARIIGHLAAMPDVEVRLFVPAEAPSQEVADALRDVALEWGADTLIFLDTDRRLPAYAFDKVVDAIQTDKRKQLLVSGVTH